MEPQGQSMAKGGRRSLFFVRKAWKTSPSQSIYSLACVAYRLTDQVLIFDPNAEAKAGP